MTEEKFNELLTQVCKFSDYTLANDFANRANKLHLIILGDDGKYWVSTPRVTEQLVKAGYEYA